jgi:Predicted acyl-CoA transferases/carnitine dehydratase
VSVLPLEGVRVLDLTTVLAGPMCTMSLGDAGADVIKIEPPGGDPARRMGPPFWGGEGAEFLALNRNKRSIVLDLKNENDRKIMYRLIESADVLVENYRTGVTDRLRIDYETAHQLNPQLVYCSISGFGRTGPRAMEPAYDAIMQAFVGMMASTGTPGGDPVRANISLCDISAGVYATQAILLALRARETTGEGQWVESSLFESQVAWLLYRAVGYFATGEAPVRKMGSGAPHVVPYEAYPTADDWIIVGALNDKLFYRMMDGMDLPHLSDDHRFHLNADRVANRVELTALLRARFVEHDTLWWMDTLTTAGVPNSRLNTVEDVLNDPQTAARDMIATMQHPRIGEIKVPGIPIKLSETPGSVRMPPPMLGQHRDEILKTLDSHAGSAIETAPDPW